MAHETVRNDWSAIIHHDDLAVIELCWLPCQMTDGAFMATLCLLATEADKVRPKGILIDALQFRHQFGAGMMGWRDAHIIPRYGAAGVRRFAFHVHADMPRVGQEAIEGPAVFPTRWFAERQAALDWLKAA